MRRGWYADRGIASLASDSEAKKATDIVSALSGLAGISILEEISLEKIAPKKEKSKMEATDMTEKRMSENYSAREMDFENDEASISDYHLNKNRQHRVKESEDYDSIEIYGNHHESKAKDRLVSVQKISEVFRKSDKFTCS